MVPGDHGSTYGGNPIGLCGSFAVLDIFKKRNLLSHVQEMGQYLWEQLEQVKMDNCEAVTDHRGMGLIQGLELAATCQRETIVNKSASGEKISVDQRGE